MSNSGLVQHIMDMGFSKELATLALSVNACRIEDAILFCVDQGEAAISLFNPESPKKPNGNTPNNNNNNNNFSGSTSLHSQ